MSSESSFGEAMENTLVDVQGMYYNNQSILYVGEGDFSFSSSHAARFGVANNIVATSLDSTGDLIEKYGMDAIQNITNLTNRGALVIHSVNACNMAETDGRLPLFASGRSLYDVVNYNFPHAGFYGVPEHNSEVIRRHTELMQGFFRNAALLLAPGGVVYVAHKCGPIYDAWNLKENANMHGLEFVGSVPFPKSDFPGYKNRRGSGDRAGHTFKLGEAAIHKFALRCKEWIENIKEHGLEAPSKEYFHLQTLRDLRALTEGSRASSKTPLLQVIKAEVARLEHLGPEKQTNLNSLKVAEKVVPLLVKILAIHQIQTLQTSRSKSLAKHWMLVQRPVLVAMEDAQNTELELLVEPDTCRLLEEEQELMEIYVSDDIDEEACEEDEEAFTAYVLDIPKACSMDRPHEDVHMKTYHGFDPVMAPTSLEKFNLCHGYDNRHSDMPGLKRFGVSHVGMEDKLDGLSEADYLEANYFGKGFIDWVVETISCCGMWFKN